MPVYDDALTLMETESYLKGLATTVLNLTRSNPERRQPWTRLDDDCGIPDIRTIALGALTYCDVYLGEQYRNCATIRNTSNLCTLDEYILLRVYHVNHSRSTIAEESDAHLTLKTKGCVCEFPPYSDMEIFKPYWIR